MTDTKAPISDDSVPLGELGGQVRRAVFWRSGSQIVSQIISWSVTLVVIRLLTPSDYGLFAMAAVMMTFLDFLNGYGFASALIQSREVDRRAIRQALGIMMLLNCSIAILQYVLAPYVAAYYDKPEVGELLRVLAFIYLATPFIIVPEVILSRGLDFKRQAVANLTAATAGASVALYCALAGFGVWTLVYAPMAVFFARAIGLTIAARMYILPSFDFRGAGHIVRFGGALMASHLFWVVQSQSDVALAGRQFSAHDVGLYAEALFLTGMVMSKFVPPLNQVAFPAYAKLRDDIDAIRATFLDSVRIVMLVTAPIFMGIAATAPTLVEVLFGPKWLEMAPLIRVIALAMPLMTLQILFAPVSNARGRPDISMRVSACGAALFLTAFIVGSHYGPQGLAFAWLFAAPLLLLATIRLARPVAEVTLPAVIAAAWPAISCAIAMGALVAAIDYALEPHMPPIPHLLLQIMGGAGLYLALSRRWQWPTLLRLIALIRGRSKPGAVAAPAPEQPSTI